MHFQLKLELIFSMKGNCKKFKSEMIEEIDIMKETHSNFTQ